MSGYIMDAELVEADTIEADMSMRPVIVNMLELADGSVTTAKLANGAVTAAKMDASLPTTPITNAEIDAVTQA